MQAVILAGGYGTRLSEESDVKPKPMVDIGGKPILWHIMKIYSAHGINDFIICLGYKGYLIKEYFSNYYLHTSDVTFDMKKNCTIKHREKNSGYSCNLLSFQDSQLLLQRVFQSLQYFLELLKKRQRDYV